MYADQGRINGIEIGHLADEAIESAGKWSEDFDEKNTLNDWVTYACMYATDAAKMGISKDEQHAKLIKAANLCLLAATRVRTGTIAPRHYDAE